MRRSWPSRLRRAPRDVAEAGEDTLALPQSMRATATAAPRVGAAPRARACTMSAGDRPRLRWNWRTASCAAIAASAPWPRPSTTNSVRPLSSSCSAQASPQTSSPGLATRRPRRSASRSALGRASARRGGPAPRCRGRATRRYRSASRQPAHRAQAVARRAGGGVAVARQAPTSAMPGPRSSASRSTPSSSSSADQQLAAAAVLDEVGRQLGGDQRDAGRRALRRSRAALRQRRRAARRASATWLASAHVRLRCMRHFQRAMVTRVPTPGARLDVELARQPLGAAQAEAEAVAGGVAVAQRGSMSGMPGPWSSKIRRTPRRGAVDDLDLDRAAAAVVERVARQLAGGGDDLGLVDEARARPRRRSARTRWRTRTTSSEVRMSKRSVTVVVVVGRRLGVARCGSAPCRARR